jgi:hypothetical protein
MFGKPSSSRSGAGASAAHCLQQCPNPMLAGSPLYNLGRPGRPKCPHRLYAQAAHRLQQRLHDVFEVGRQQRGRRIDLEARRQLAQRKAHLNRTTTSGSTFSDCVAVRDARRVALSWWYHLPPGTLSARARSPEQQAVVLTIPLAVILSEVRNAKQIETRNPCACSARARLETCGTMADGGPRCAGAPSPRCAARRGWPPAARSRPRAAPARSRPRAHARTRRCALRAARQRRARALPPPLCLGPPAARAPREARSSWALTLVKAPALPSPHMQRRRRLVPAHRRTPRPARHTPLRAVAHGGGPARSRAHTARRRGQGL